MEITLEHVSFLYDADRNHIRKALTDISLTIRDGDFIGLIGHTGSGKSTMIQMLNGLMKPTEGRVLFNGENVNEKGYPLKTLRRKVGLVFQYPEHQLFETDVLKDVCFGPKNMGLSKEEQEAAAREALKRVGISEDDFDKSPFELSGGQKRRVAIAGVLAMKPECLILDEPTAGLDPEGRDEILDLIRQLNQNQGITIVLVSHSMEDVAEYAKRLVVMEHGSILYDAEPRTVFRHAEKLREIGLSIPEVTEVMQKLKAKGLSVNDDVITVEEAKQEILRAFQSQIGKTEF